MAYKPNCQVCGAEMRKKVQTSGRALGYALALIVFLIGLVLCFTLIGAVIGVPLMVLALFIGGKRSKVWRCVQCRAVIARG